MKKSLRFVILFLLFALASQAQKMPSHITVIKDPFIDSIIQKRMKLYSIAATVNGKNAYNNLPSKGYRVQIFYGNDRREVFAKQAQFRNLFPDFGTYLTYKEPNYYLKVGDFRTRNEAQEFLKDARKYFSTTFISYEKINPLRLKPLAEEEEEISNER